MASLLHRLGLLAARRAKTVITAWLALLVIAVGSFAAFGGQLSDQITVPDMPTTAVADRLAEELPGASGGTTTVVFRTLDDSTFTAAQREEIAELAERAENLDDVDTVSDPFVAQQEMGDAAEELDAARVEISEGWAEIEEGREALQAGRAALEEQETVLDAAQAEIDAQREVAEEAGTLELVEPALAPEQEQLDAGREELESARTEIEESDAALDEGTEELAGAEAELDRGAAMLELSEELRLVSEDGTTAVMMVSFSEPLEAMGAEQIGTVGDVFAEASIDGVDILPSSELSAEAFHLFSVGEVIGLAVAAAVLIIMLGTLIGAGLPLVNALVGVGIGVTGALAFSGAVEMMAMTPILGLMLGLAVGIDYALFILYRHRKQLRAGMGVTESIALANGTSGNAVVFAGATVVIALVALNLTGLPFLGLMGTVGAICVAIAVLMAVTMTPALLSLVGERILRRSERAEAASAQAAGHRAEEKITTPMGNLKAAGMALGAVVLLAAMAIPTFSLRLGLPDASSQSEDSSSYQAYAAIDEAFGQGMNGPLLVVADLEPGLDEGGATDLQIEVARGLAAHDDVAAAVPVGLNEDFDVAVFQLVPEEGPASEAVEALVHELRGGEMLTGAEFSGVELSVAGLTAANIDISDFVGDAFPLYLVVVIGLSLVLMTMVFRSLVLPLIATAGFVLSFAAALGGVVAVFQWGWLSGLFGVTEPGPVLSFLPIVMVGILFGLAMDYQLFTASGMREAYAHGSAPRLAVRQGLHAGRAVVTAAALIMASVFGGFIFAGDPMVSSIGLALALGVLLDAFVVRLVLVPALLHLVGPAAWWLPSWLDKLLPDVDVEGARLERG